MPTCISSTAKRQVRLRGRARKTVGRGVSLGSACVQRGEGDRLRLLRRFDETAMARAARTAAEIAESAARPGPSRSSLG